MSHTPLVQIDKVEIINNNTYHNHIDTGELIHKLNRIYKAVVNDTAIEEALLEQNEELRNQVEALLTGETLPPAVQEKVNAIFDALKANKEKLKKGIEENQPKSL
jgi:hypothetical protein